MLQNEYSAAEQPENNMEHKTAISIQEVPKSDKRKPGCIGACN
jgi:hypothetical protein